MTALGVPVASRRTTWLATAAVLVLYALTMARDLGAYDSALLALAGAELGLAHPPGEPVHTVLAALFARLPGIAPLVGMSLLSAVAGALTVIPVMSLADGMRGAEQRGGHGIVALVVVTGAVHAALWEPSTRVEVYPLAAFFLVWAIARIAALRAGRLAPRRRSWLTAGVVLGLGASVNPVMAFLVGLALVPTLLRGLLRRELPVGSLLAAVGGGLLGLLPYVYVPWVATRDVLAWGAPVDAAALRFYFSGADFAGNLATGAHVGEHVGEWLVHAARTAHLPLVVAGVGGFLWRGDRTGLGRVSVLLLFALTLVLVASNTIWHVEILDYLGYLAPVSWLCVAGAAGLTLRGDRPLTTVLVVLWIGTAIVATPRPFARTRAADHLLRDVATGALTEAPPGAVILVASDHLVFPLLYLQEVEGLRPDVVLLPHGLASSSWYWERLWKRHPDLVPVDLRAPSRDVRILNFLAANPRPLGVENPGLLAAARRVPCAVSWLAWTDGCDTLRPPQYATAALGRQRDLLGDGSPPSHGVLALLAEDRGELLWRLGRPRDAYAAFLAGVPARALPVAPSPADLVALDDAPPLRGPLPAPRGEHIIGDPVRPLVAAGAIAHAAGLADLAASHAAAAARLD